MPIHDWTRVEAGIFHDFHLEWISRIKATLNNGLLPPGYYALAEQIAGGVVPDVVTLHSPTTISTPTMLAVTTHPPQVQYRTQAAPDSYAAKRRRVTIRHTSNHQVVAVVEVVSPGNKNSRHGIRSFVEKAAELLRGGIHLLILDLFPPGPRDPEGIHKVIWDEFQESDYGQPADAPLTLASYRATEWPEAFVEPIAVGHTLPEMPVFLTTEEYVSLPLEAGYESAFQAVPQYWREVIANA